RHKSTTLFQRAIQINRITANNLLEFGLYLLFRSLLSASINSLVQLGIKSRISSEINLHLVVCILAVVDSCNNASSGHLLLAILATIARIARATSQHTDGHNAGQSQSQ